jgi:hypothetical protein
MTWGAQTSCIKPGLTALQFSHLMTIQNCDNIFTRRHYGFHLYMLHNRFYHKTTCRKSASWWKENVYAVPTSCQGPRTLAQYPVWPRLQGQRSLLQGVTQLPQYWLIPRDLGYRDTSPGLHVHKTMPVVHRGMQDNHWKRFKPTLTDHSPMTGWQVKQLIIPY